MLSYLGLEPAIGVETTRWRLGSGFEIPGLGCEAWVLDAGFVMESAGLCVGASATC